MVTKKLEIETELQDESTICEQDVVNNDPIEDLKKSLEEYKKLAEERFEDIKYLQADFDNYRKKFDKEKENIIKYANENLITELIIILDDFESSVRLLENEKNKEGIVLMQKKFFELLQKHGLKEIESLGKKFNPNFHEVLCKELSEHDEDQVIEEIQKGYILCSKIIRPTKVKISEGNKN